MLQTSTKIYQKLQKQYSRRINLDLKRIKKVLEKLGNPENYLNNVINVVGSDGKNSFLTSLKFFLEAESKKVNAFTSPHLYDVRQRFYLGGRFISLKEIVKYKRLIEKTRLKLTLFELLTCIYILSAKKTDFNSYNLIESGLLFKKDSTNLWSLPIAQVVTNLNMQHAEWIKPKTINEICRQKVGYLSNNTTIYIGKQKLKTLKIVKNILKKNLSNHEVYGSWKIINKKKQKYYKDNNNLIKLLSKNIHSEGLWENVCLAIKVALDLGVRPKIIKKTIPKIIFEGRVQYTKGKLTKILHKKEALLLDGCHSDVSTQNLSSYLKKIKLPIYGICGIQKNKNPNKLIKNFNGIFKKIFAVQIPDEPNSMNSREMYKIMKKQGFICYEAKNIKDALKKITSNEKKIIVIFGSLYLVGNALSMN